MPANEKFQQQLIQARRNQILQAAIEVISENGFQRTTVKQIAQRAEVADGTIYNYFKNKDAILMGIIAMITEAEERELHFAEAAQISFEEFVTTYVAHRMEEVEMGLPVLKAILPEMIVNEEIAKTINEKIYEPSFRVAEEYIAQQMKAGIISEADPVVAARLFASPLLGLFFLRLLGDEHVTANWQAYAKAMGQLLVKGFGTQEDPEKKSFKEQKDSQTE
ncbi:MAG: TetR/AcrR family transcriptional regulator [Chloroflexota bacterium]